MEYFRSVGILLVVRDSSMKCLYIGSLVEARYFKICRGKGSGVNKIWRVHSDYQLFVDMGYVVCGLNYI